MLPRIWLALTFSILFIPVSAQISYKEARLQFQKAVKDEKACKSFIKELDKAPENDYLLRAYRGAANIVMAKFVSMPNTRLSYFLDGKEDLDLAVEKLPQSVEVRYLRFRIQENTPTMLFYDDQDEDIPILVARINDVIDPDYRDKIRNFVIDSGKLTEEQIRQIKK